MVFFKDIYRYNVQEVSTNVILEGYLQINVQEVSTNVILEGYLQI